MCTRVDTRLLKHGRKRTYGEAAASTTVSSAWSQGRPSVSHPRDGGAEPSGPRTVLRALRPRPPPGPAGAATGALPAADGAGTGPGTRLLRASRSFRFRPSNGSASGRDPFCLSRHLPPPAEEHSGFSSLGQPRGAARKRPLWSRRGLLSPKPPGSGEAPTEEGKSTAPATRGGGGAPRGPRKAGRRLSPHRPSPRAARSRRPLVAPLPLSRRTRARAGRPGRSSGPAAAHLSRVHGAREACPGSAATVPGRRPPRAGRVSSGAPLGRGLRGDGDSRKPPQGTAGRGRGRGARFHFRFSGRAAPRPGGGAWPTPGATGSARPVPGAERAHSSEGPWGPSAPSPSPGPPGEQGVKRR